MPLNLIRGPQVDRKCGWTRWTRIRTRKKDPTFPKPIALAPNSLAWIEAEIDEWITRKMKEREITEATMPPPNESTGPRVKTE